MGVDVKLKVDVSGEEGEISDPESIVEIAKEEFKPAKQSQQPQQNQNQNQNQSSKTISDSSSKNNRYWMNYTKYSYPSGYGSGLYNLAWAQAVQNKPLNDVLVEFKEDGQEKTSKAGTVTDETCKEQSNDVGVDAESEKEEGELEEGEIDLDSEEPNNNNNGEREEECVQSGSGYEMEDGELEKQVSSIRKVFDNVTVSEAHKSFDVVVARLKSSLESLRELVLHTWFPSKDALIQRSFAAIQCVNSVFSSMSASLRDQKRDKMSRLLTLVMSLSSCLFSPEQRKEVEDMITSINPPPPVPQKPKPRDKQEELPVADKAILTDSNTLTVNSSDNGSEYWKKLGLDRSFDPSDQKNINTLSDVMKPFQSNLKGRGLLLDLHKVHDEDSLPSPTSKTTPLVSSFDSAVSRVVPGVQKSGVHPYETDALKAVSTYQQRFGRSTFLPKEELPSPTPSEEGNEGGPDEANDEVSSFAAYNNVRNTSPLLLQSIVSSALNTSSSPMQGLVSSSSSSVGLSSAGSNPALRASAKSRDPRLRHNPSLGSVDLSFCPSPVGSTSASKLEPLGDIMNQKKSKAPLEPILGGPVLKKQRNGYETTEMSMNVNELQTGLGSSGLENSGNPGSQFASRGFLNQTADPRKSGIGAASSGITNVSPSLPMNTTSSSVTNVSTTPSLQYLLKDIAGNPALLRNIFKEQQKSSEQSPVSHPANSNSVLGVVPLSNIASTSSSMVGQTGTGLLQVPPIVVSSPQEESAKLRMKPRDPRRILHNNTAQKSGNSGPEQAKINGLHNANTQGAQDSFNNQRHVSGTNTNPATSQSPVLPDISQQFTKNLENIAGIISAPQTSSVQPVLPMSSPQLVQVNLDRISVNSGGPVNSSDQRKGSALRPEEVVAGRPQSQNAWGDVEHLFDGYDDKQKAAIQQERSRRIDEQKKMFAARKLCLVLDLDHTLLNSAKFTEVDPVHDEILRKKEEQDREKPRRHLFRFPHMAMWTKLRPGIWNFLEKASKLYELHLYTMGNKLYATEMAKVLDPKGVLFAGRVISKGDDGDLIDGDERVPKSKDLEGVLGMESAVVIIDDSVRVWPHNKLNLIVVERYTYFPCSRRQFGLPGPSLLEIDHDERPEDGTLASSLAVIEKLHQLFFAHKSLDDVDVRNILAAEQRKILGGCRIVFSRVFPVGEANPHLHPLWQTAEQFGAVCTNQIDEQVTHVVANSVGTDKVNWALSTGRFVVHPGWVEASALLYRRANEQDFAIKS